MIKQLLFFIVIITGCIFFNACSNGDSLGEILCEDTNCVDYSSRLQAQIDFDLNPDCRGDLDADN
ncbi:MAG: hypothetical protein AB8B69_19585, partial [Chitinophagales bacterium]